MEQDDSAPGSPAGPRKPRKDRDRAHRSRTSSTDGAATDGTEHNQEQNNPPGSPSLQPKKHKKKRQQQHNEHNEEAGGSGSPPSPLKRQSLSSERMDLSLERRSFERSLERRLNEAQEQLSERDSIRKRKQSVSTLSVEGRSSSKEKLGGGSKRGSTRSTRSRRSTATILDTSVFDLTPEGSTLLSNGADQRPDTDHGELSSSPPPSHSSSSIAMAPHLIEQARSQAAAAVSAAAVSITAAASAEQAASAPPLKITMKRRSQKNLPPQLGSSSDETIPPSGSLARTPRKKRPAGPDRLSKDNLQILDPSQGTGKRGSRNSSLSGESHPEAKKQPIRASASAFSASSGSDKQAMSLKPAQRSLTLPKKSRSLTFKPGTRGRTSRQRPPIDDKKDSGTDPGTDIEREPLKTDAENMGSTFKRTTLQRQSPDARASTADSSIYTLSNSREPTSRLAKFLARYEAADLTLELDDADDDEEDFLSMMTFCCRKKQEEGPEVQPPVVPGVKIELRKGRRAQHSAEPKVWVAFTFLTLSTLLKATVICLDIYLMVNELYDTTLTIVINGVLFGVFLLSLISMAINYYSIHKRKMRSIFVAALLFFPIVVFEIIFVSVLVAFQDTFRVEDEETEEIAVRSVFRMFAFLVLPLQLFQMLTCTFEFRLYYQIRKSRREEILIFVKRETLPDDLEATF